jgi:Mn2+/Fe2+ NRAMP family transporter
MYWLSKSIHRFSRLNRRFAILAAVVGPGIITMIADNDAGGISTYAVTGSKYGFNLLWVFIILIPMAYFVQEMTVRLGAVTKRGHAEAIFDGFGRFWGWFSLFDLAVVNWLTLVTEYIGMTAAMSMFGIPPIVTCIAVTIILMAVVMTGRYWTFEKITLAFCISDRSCLGGSGQRVLQSGLPERSYSRPHFHHNGQYRDDNHAVADLLPAEFGG